MKRIFLVVLLGVSAGCPAQRKEFALYARANYPIIPSVTERPRLAPVPTTPGYYSSIVSPSFTESFEVRPGFDLGGRMHYNFSDEWFGSIGLSISYFRFKRSVNLDSPWESLVIDLNNPPGAGQPYGVIYGSTVLRNADGSVSVNPDGTLNWTPAYVTSSEVGKTATWYLQVPLLAGISLVNNKLLLRSGFSFGYLIGASVYQQQYSYPGNSVEVYNDHSKKDFNSFSFAILMDATCPITKKIGADFSAQRNLSAIYNASGQIAGMAKPYAFSLGLSFLFGKLPSTDQR